MNQISNKVEENLMDYCTVILKTNIESIEDDMPRFDRIITGYLVDYALRGDTKFITLGNTILVIQTVIKDSYEQGQENDIPF